MTALGDSASAFSGDVELAISVARTVLRVALSNRGEEPLAVYFAAQSPTGRHHDFLTVRIAGDAGERPLRFTGDRNISTTGLAVLGPGEEIADDLDLAAWARDPINGGVALARGDHALTATYRVDQPGAWAGAVSAGPVRLHVA